jgi:hypothetical protein
LETFVYTSYRIRRYRNRAKSLIWIGWKAWKIVEKGEGIRREDHDREVRPLAMAG